MKPEMDKLKGINSKEEIADKINEIVHWINFHDWIETNSPNMNMLDQIVKERPKRTYGEDW